MPRLLGEMDHDECAPWCDHNPNHHAEDCSESFCDGYGCWKKHVGYSLENRVTSGPEQELRVKNVEIPDA